MRGIKLFFHSYSEYQEFRAWIGEYLEHLLPDDHTFVEIALNEAVNNSFLHGAKPTKTHSLVTLSIHIHKNKRVVIRIKDQGKGFNYRKYLRTVNQRYDENDEDLWEDAGRGLFIMYKTIDALKFNKKGNEVMLMKKMPDQRAKPDAEGTLCEGWD